MKKLMIIFFGMILCWGCENDDFLYQGEEGGVSGIYFLKATSTSMDGTPLGYTDSVSYSFQNDNLSVTTKKITIPVKSLGMLSEEDRPFKVKVIGGNAVEGEDFVALPDEFIFPKKSAEAEAYVEIIRTTKLVTESRYVVVELVENDFFKLLLPQLKNISSSDTLKTNVFKISFTEKITEMDYYSFMGKDIFGNWSVKKFHMINEIGGWTLQDWLYWDVNYGKFAYVATLMRRELQALADGGNPFMDEENGEYMQLGDSYKVDYSKYESD